MLHQPLGIWVGFAIINLLVVVYAIKVRKLVVVYCVERHSAIPIWKVCGEFLFQLLWVVEFVVYAWVVWGQYPQVRFAGGSHFDFQSVFALMSQDNCLSTFKKKAFQFYLKLPVNTLQLKKYKSIVW
jgi:hypothetical protein